MVDKAEVLAWLQEVKQPGEMIFVATVAERFFPGNLLGAKECLDALVEAGSLERVPLSGGRATVIQLPQPGNGQPSSPAPPPRQGREEYTLEDARAGWAEISEHRTARGLGDLRSDPRAFISAFGTSAGSVGQAMEARRLKSREFRQLVIKHAPAVAAHLDRLCEEVAQNQRQGKDSQKPVRELFVALLGERASELHPDILSQFERSGLGTVGAIVGSVKTHSSTVRLALEAARLVEGDKLGDAVTRFQQQNMSWPQVCAEVALLLSQKRRKAEAASPADPPDVRADPGHRPHQKNLHSVFQDRFRQLWQAVKQLDVEGALQKSGIHSFNDLQTLVSENGDDLGVMLERLNLADSGLGQFISEHYSHLSDYNQGLVNSHESRLVDLRHAWREVCAFPEVGEWGVSFVGQMVDQFCNLLESLQDDLDAALAKQAKDPNLQRLLVLHLISFQMHSREMMTNEDMFGQSRRQDRPRPLPQPLPSPPSPPPPRAAGEGRRSTVPTLTQRPKVHRGLPDNWDQLKDRLEAQGIHFGSEDELIAAVKENRGVVGWVLNKQRPADRQNKLSGGFVSMVRRYLDQRGVQTATRNAPIGGGPQRPSQPDTPPAPATRPSHKKGGARAQAPAPTPPASVPAVVPAPAVPVSAIGDGLAQGMLAMLAAANAGHGVVAVDSDVEIAGRAAILMGPLAMQASHLVRLPVAEVVREALKRIGDDREVAAYIRSQPEMQTIMEANSQIMAALDHLAHPAVR